MLRHLVTSAILMAPGLGAIAFVRWRYGEGERTLRRFAIAYGVVLVTIAGVSAASTVTLARCPRDPDEWCEYNDSVPAMAVLAFGYALAGCGRAWMLYSEK